MKCGKVLAECPICRSNIVRVVRVFKSEASVIAAGLCIFLLCTASLMKSTSLLLKIIFIYFFLSEQDHSTN